MKSIFLGALMALTTLSVNAQDDFMRSSEVKVTKSEPYEVVDAYAKRYFTLNDGSILSIKNKGKKGNTFIFQKFSGDQLNEVRREEVVISTPGFNLEYFVELGEKLYMFYSVYDKPNKTEQLFVQEVNQDGAGLNGDEVQLLSVPQKISAAYYVGYSAQGKFRIDTSSDGSFFIIKYRLQPEEKNDSKSNDILGMHVFDQELNKVWGEDIQMPYLESMMRTLDFTIDSKGTGYFLIKKYEEEVNRKNANDVNNQSFAIMEIKNGTIQNEEEFDLGENLIEDVVMKENAEGNIICAGYYSTSKSYGTEGAFITTYSNGQLSEPKFYEFTLEFIKMYNNVSERKAKKLEKADNEGRLSMNNLYMRNIVTMKDGSIALIGEIFYITTYTDSKGNTHTTYHYNDVIITKLDADGELEWMQKLYKRSIVESYRQFSSENNLYVFFTSFGPKEVDGEVVENKVAAYVTAHKIDSENGEVKKLFLFTRGMIDGQKVYQYSLSRIIAINENNWAVELYIKKKKDRMFKLSFEE